MPSKYLLRPCRMSTTNYTFKRLHWVSNETAEPINGLRPFVGEQWFAHAAPAGARCARSGQMRQKSSGHSSWRVTLPSVSRNMSPALTGDTGALPAAIWDKYEMLTLSFSAKAVALPRSSWMYCLRFMPSTLTNTKHFVK
jgi:hypothetical protein